MVYILLFTTLELCLVLDSASQFTRADGKHSTSAGLMKAAGAFAFIASLLGYYCVAHYMCEDGLPFRFPMGDTDFLVKSRGGDKDE